MLKQRLDYIQNIAIQKISLEHSKNNRTYITMPTGTGKTHVGIKYIKKLNSKVLWITQTEELIFETASRLSDFHTGIIKADRFDVSGKVTVASVQTIHKEDRLLALGKDFFDLIIVDEAHHVVAPTWKKIIDYFDSLVLGLTATDVRADGLELSDVIGNKCFDLSYEEAKRKNLIASEICKVIITNSVIEGVTVNLSDYKPSQLEKLVTSANRNKIIIDSYRDYALKEVIKKGMRSKAICFCVDIAHAKRMSNLFNKNNIKSDYLVSKDLHSQTINQKRRKEIYNKFKTTHEIEVLCVVDIMNEGKNVPDINIVLMARPTLSITVYIQQLGRASRLIEGIKDFYVVLDYVDNADREFYSVGFHSSRPVVGYIADEDIVLDYYTGKDPIIKEYVKLNLSKKLSDFKDRYEWNKPDAIEALKTYISKKGIKEVTYKNMSARNNLPSRRKIEKLFGGIREYIKSTGIEINYKEEKSYMSKSDIALALINFSENKDGFIAVTDLGHQNNLPSIKLIKKHWGSFTKCAEIIGLVTRQNRWNTKAKIKKAVLKYPNLTIDDLKNENDLPSKSSVIKIYGSYKRMIYEVFNKSTVLTSSHYGVYKRDDSDKFRSYINIKGKAKSIGTFNTESDAYNARKIMLEYSNKPDIDLNFDHYKKLTISKLNKHKG